MNYKSVLFSVSFIAILSAIYFVVFPCHRKLPAQANYVIVSNTGQSIPAKLYARTVETKSNNQLLLVREFFLAFSDSLVLDSQNVLGEHHVPKFLVLVPYYKMIGIPDHMHDLKERDGYICQSSDKADYFAPIVNNHALFKNPPITEVQFTERKISFNTFGILKKFGQSIIIRKK